MIRHQQKAGGQLCELIHHSSISSSNASEIDPALEYPFTAAIRQVILPTSGGRLAGYYLNNEEACDEPSNDIHLPSVEASRKRLAASIRQEVGTMVRTGRRQRKKALGLILKHKHSR